MIDVRGRRTEYFLLSDMVTPHVHYDEVPGTLINDNQALRSMTSERWSISAVDSYFFSPS